MPNDGYIVEGVDGTFLDSGFHWRKCKNQSETYVHDAEELGNIIFMSQSWEIKLSQIYPAMYDHSQDEDNRVSLLSSHPIILNFPDSD